MKKIQELDRNLEELGRFVIFSPVWASKSSEKFIYKREGKKEGRGQKNKKWQQKTPGPHLSPTELEYLDLEPRNLNFE